MTPRSFAWAMAVTLLAIELLAGCSPPPATSPPALVPTQPATQPVSALLEGCLVSIDQEQSIVGLRLPAREPFTIGRRWKQNPAMTYVYALAGPDREGRVAFVEGSMRDKNHALKTIDLDGTAERVVFTRPGDAIWDHVIGQQMAMSADGRVAITTRLQGVQMPGALLFEGNLELSGLDGSPSKVFGTAVDLGMSWFPDGQRLAIVRWIQRDEAAARLAEIKPLGKKMARWPRVPAVFVLDTRTGQASFLHLGMRPVVATDGKTVLVSDLPGEPTPPLLVNVADGSARSAAITSIWPVIALTADGTCIYLDRPSPDDPKGKTLNNSPLSGPKDLLVVKAAAPGAATDETLWPGRDPRAPISFGQPTTNSSTPAGSRR